MIELSPLSLLDMIKDYFHILDQNAIESLNNYCPCLCRKLWSLPSSVLLDELVVHGGLSTERIFDSPERILVAEVLLNL
jgi:hypothetical protein